jgi:hypothetical protein
MANLTDATTPRLDSGLYKVCMLVARLGLAYLFFTQLWWKLPPNFGCGANFAFPTPAAQNYWNANGSSGLCYWMGLESIFASRPRQVFVADMRPAGLPRISLDITPIARLNGFLLDNLFIPNIRIFGWLIWLSEAWIFTSMLLGLFTRLGAIVGLAVSAQLFIGLANIPRPFEWEWSYGTILFLSIAMLAATAGRFVGLDAWIHRKLTAAPRNFWVRLGLFLS